MKASAVFNKLFILWKFIGIDFCIKQAPNKLETAALKICTFTIKCFIIYYYAFGLAINLTTFEFTAMYMENVVFTVVFNTSFLKYILTLRNRSKMLRILEIADELYLKTQQMQEENKFMDEFKISSERVFKTFYSMLSVLNISGIMYMPAIEEEHLLIEQYFPFDWKNNSSLRLATIGYQLLGFIIYITWTLTFDCFIALIISLLNTNLKILSYRTSMIQSRKDLVESIADHQLICEMITLVQDSLSTVWLSLFFQTIVSVVVYSTVVITTDLTLIEAIFIVISVFGFLLEISFTCYYGSEFSHLTERLPHAVYSCSWIAENAKDFRKDISLFIETCLIRQELSAGGLFSVDLKTFLSIIKTIYSYLMVFRTYYANKINI